MLQAIREKSQGLIAIIIIGILSLVFALWGIQYWLTGSNNSGIVAKVNGTIISQQQLSTAYQRLKVQISKNGKLPPNLNTTALKNLALRQLINPLIVSQSATSAGLVIPPAEINAIVFSMPAFQQDKQFSPERFQTILSNNNLTSSDVIADIKNEQLTNQMRFGITNSAFTLKNELQDAQKIALQKRDVGYAVIQAKQFINSVSVSDDEIKTYYQTNQRLFELPEQASIQYVVLSPNKITSGVKLNSNEVRQYYQSNIGQFTREKQYKYNQLTITLPASPSKKQLADANTLAKKIDKSLLENKRFIAIAKQYSLNDDGVSNKWHPISQITSLDQQMLNQLKTGQVSKVFRNDDGLVYLKLLSIKRESIVPFSSAKKDLTKRLLAEKQQQVVAQTTDMLSNLSYANPNSLVPAANKLKLTIFSTGVFTKQGTKTGIASNPQIITAAFNPDVLIQGNNSSVIQLPGNRLAVIRVAKHVESAVKPMNAVKGLIIRRLKAAKAAKKAEEIGAQVIADYGKATKKGSFKALNWRWLNQVPITSQSNQFIIQKAFLMPVPGGRNKPSVLGITMPDGDYSIVVVKKIYNPAGRRISATTKTKLLNQQQLIEYMSYIGDYTAQAKVKIY